MLMIQEDILKKVLDNSLHHFFEKETNQIINGVNERNLCGRLAVYLQEEAAKSGLQDYFADVEYNRKKNGEIKTIIDNNFEVSKINCDLILHSRGKFITQDNLIAIEMKKSSGSMIEKKKDRNRLKALTQKSDNNNLYSNDRTTDPEHVSGYILGVYIEFNTLKRTVLYEYYKNGEMTKILENKF